MKTDSTGSVPESKLMLPRAGHDHIQGRIDAPFALVEFGDYECPYCGEAYLLVKAIQAQLGDRLCFAFRNFPLANIHPYAEHAAQAAEAAAAQGKFWEMHDVLFENQTALTDEDLAEYATAISLDSRRLIADVLAGTYKAKVREDFRSGVHAGVNGTPSFFINGLRYDGTRNLEEMVATLTGTADR